MKVLLGDRRAMFCSFIQCVWSCKGYQSAILYTAYVYCHNGFHWVKAIVINSLHVWYVGTGCLVLWYVGTGCLVRDLRMMFDGWTLSQPSIYQPKNSPPHKRPQLLWFVDTYPGNDCSPYCKRRFSLSPFHIYWSIWGMAPIETLSWNYVWPCAN